MPQCPTCKAEIPVGETVCPTCSEQSLPTYTHYPRVIPQAKTITEKYGLPYTVSAIVWTGLAILILGANLFISLTQVVEKTVIGIAFYGFLFLQGLTGKAMLRGWRWARLATIILALAIVAITFANFVNVRLPNLLVGGWTQIVALILLLAEGLAAISVIVQLVRAGRIDRALGRKQSGIESQSIPLPPSEPKDSTRYDRHEDAGI